MALRPTIGIALGLGVLGAAGAAQAGLEICNDSEAFQSIAIGYLGDEGWTSEGWWLIEPGGCVEPITGDLQQRYYYYRALVDGVPLVDDGYDFCTEPSAFTIVGDTDCEARGYQTAVFKEIDTGETALHHIERIDASAVPVPPMDDEMTDEMPDMDDEPLVTDDSVPEDDDFDDDDFDVADDFDDFEDDFGGDQPNMRRGGSRL